MVLLGLTKQLIVQLAGAKPLVERGSLPPALRAGAQLAVEPDAATPARNLRGAPRGHMVRKDLAGVNRDAH